MKYQVAQWEINQVGTRIDTREIVEADYYDARDEAFEAAQRIVEDKPEGIAFVTVARVNEKGETLDDEYLLDEKIS